MTTYLLHGCPRDDLLSLVGMILDGIDQPWKLAAMIAPEVNWTRCFPIKSEPGDRRGEVLSEAAMQERSTKISARRTKQQAVRKQRASP